ncbi:TetR/AcrR family transcriptional regulator [Peribacillus sp. NPDC097264]|uniref:TetR/AcrR family transcriptional regulator n=1 Tax=Peribacillus sp. NPDC097264 TaxID=3390616 RepID=UPI003D041AC2
METAKESIVAAYLQLLFEKSFEELAVKEIVQKAGISRSTFYLHFADKYELMDEVRRKLNDRFLSFYEMDYQWGKPITLHLCEHIFKYRSFYELEFAEAGAIQKLSDKLAAHLQEVFQDPDYALFASYGTIGYLGKERVRHESGCGSGKTIENRPDKLDKSIGCKIRWNRAVAGSCRPEKEGRN